MGCKDVKRRQKGLQSKAKSIGTARRYIEGAIVEESRRGKKMESPFASRSVLLLAFITLDLLNWNFDPIKLCLPLAAMASSKPPLLSRRQLHSLSLQTFHLGVGPRFRPTQNWKELARLASTTPKSSAGGGACVGWLLACLLQPLPVFR